MAFQITITTGGNRPIYRQITDQVRLAVATGLLSADDRLPSVRAQAQRLLVNPNTVARAYGDLVKEGVLRSEPGRGLFVNSKRSVYTKSERSRRLRPALDAFVREGLALDFSAEEMRVAFEKALARIQAAAGNPDRDGSQQEGDDDEQ